MASNYVVYWCHVCCYFNTRQSHVYNNRDIVHDHRIEKWRELHICNHNTNCYRPSSRSGFAIHCDTRFHGEAISSKKEFTNAAVVARFVHIDRKENMERIRPLLYCGHETQGPQGFCFMRRHSESGEKRQISCHVNQTARRGGIAHRYIVLT